MRCHRSRTGRVRPLSAQLEYLLLRPLLVPPLLPRLLLPLLPPLLAPLPPPLLPFLRPFDLLLLVMTSVGREKEGINIMGCSHGKQTLK